MLYIFYVEQEAILLLFSEIIINEGYTGMNPVSYGYQTCEPSHSYGPAVRTHWLLHYVVSGTGIFLRDGQQHQVRPGEAFVIPPFLETYYEADATDPWKYIWIGFTSDMELPPELQKPVIRFPGMGNIFENMRRCQNMQNGKSAFLAGCIWELLSVTLESNNQKNNYIEQALHYMNAEYMTNLSVALLAQRLNLDRCYFSTLFNRQVGVSPSQYLVKLRLEKAAELMLYHNQSPSVAAASVGYTDIYNFSKMFKKKYGCAPRHYIQANKAVL